MTQLCSFISLLAGLVPAQAISLRSRRVPLYYWPHARGHPGEYSTTDLVGPETSLNTSLAWSWHHPDGRYHTVVTSGPLIDDMKNIYLASEDGVRKFRPDGNVAWYYKSEAPIATCPSLMDGMLFGNTINGHVFALDMESGEAIWDKTCAQAIAGDTAYVESYDGIVITGVDPSPSGGANRVLGLNAHTGHQVWEFHSDNFLWNFMPLLTPDDAVIAMSISGDVYKIGLHNGTLLWKANSPPKSSSSFSDGGVILGPDGTSYTCSNYEGSGQEGERGALRAFALGDGHMLWEQVLDKPCNSWPVVTRDGATVVVPSGSFVSSPSASNPELRDYFHKSAIAMHKFSLSLGNKELRRYGIPDKRATVMAFDAKTGEPSWSKDLPPYGRMAAAGDEEGYLERQGLHHRDQCLPAQFGAPTISGDGTFYVGRADGNLYAVRPDGNGGAVVSTFQTGAGFLHPGTSWAPGMMAVTSCDGLFVWKF